MILVIEEWFRDDRLRAAIRGHAERAYPRECCGVVLEAGGTALEYVACLNLAPKAHSHFIMSAADYLACQERGRVLAVVHSHPNQKAGPSLADRVSCRRGGVPWIIVGWPLDDWAWVDPDQGTLEVPLLGREFVYGVFDCYTLVRDYYRCELGLELPWFDSEYGWWKTGHRSMYVENFEKAGFVRVEDGPKDHDSIFMYLRSQVPNHVAVYLQKGLILHHVENGLSRVEPYGGFWVKNVAFVVRHRSLC